MDALLRELGIAPAEIDVIALAGARAAAKEWLNRVLTIVGVSSSEHYGVALAVLYDGRWAKRIRKWGARFGLMDASSAQSSAFLRRAPGRRGGVHLGASP